MIVITSSRYCIAQLHCVCFSHCSLQLARVFRCIIGTPVPPNTPINIISPTGTYVRTDNSSSPATAGTGTGTGTGGTAPEQYLAFHAGNLTSSSPIQPYTTTVLQSVQTGLYCRLAPLPSNTTQIGMVCDQASASTATVLTYTGDGLSYNGIDLVATGPGQPLLLENTTASPVPGPTADNLTLVPALVGVWPDTPTDALHPPHVCATIIPAAGCLLRC
jgi:hypothetical protein